ncbi:hypothetical protein FX155_00105 [Acidaminococcus fermentans]|uniref:Uncharacterized protein n=1 Tax=Acidaminococcus fermentans TaxID=905 RepID=A0A6N7VVC6_ACIFE|nr:hypothetical protein [Acidaminococcus fermentans]MSS81031.1 hypothetical protein [Acidaminococcus fermentans]
MTGFQKIVVGLLAGNLLCTFGLYLRLDSQQLLLEKEVRSMKRDIVGTRYDDTNLKNSLASLEKQVGKLDENTRKAREQENPAAPAPAPQPQPKKDPSGIQGLIDRIFGR